MTYDPNNVCVYLRAQAGYMGGVIAARNQPTDTDEVDYSDAAARADFFAQAVDQAWVVSAHTDADLQQIQSAAASLLASGRSIVPGAAGLSAIGYAQTAAAIVAGVRAGTARIVAEGIDPNGCAGGSGFSLPIVVTNPQNIIQDATSGQSILQTVSDILIINGSEGTLFLSANNAAIVSVDTAGMFPVVNGAYTLGLSGAAWLTLFVGSVPGSGGVNSLFVNPTNIHCGGLVGGNANIAFAFDSTPTPLDVSAASIVLSDAEKITPVIPLTGAINAANCTITLPNRPGAVWYFGCAAVTFGGKSLIFTTGAGTSATVTALKAGGYTLVMVCVTGSNVVEAG